jgi:hypothetical protein
MKNEMPPHRRSLAAVIALEPAQPVKSARPHLSAEARPPSKIARTPGAVKRIAKFLSRPIARIDVSDFAGSCRG